jgi:predicted dehydrogenase
MAIVNQNDETYTAAGMKMLYFDTWRRSPSPLPFPGCVTVKVLHACTPGGQDHIRARVSKIELLRQIFQARRRMLKRAFRYLQAIGGKRTLAKVRSNVLEYQSQLLRTVAAISGVVVETGGVDGVDLGSIVAGYRVGHPLYADFMLLHPEQMTQVPSGCCPEDAAALLYYGMASEAFNRIKHEHGSLRTVVLCGDTLPCRLLETLFRDARIQVEVFLETTPESLGLVKKAIERGNPVVIAKREWHRALKETLPEGLAYLVGLTAEDYPEDEWKSLESHWIGLPHPDVRNLNIFSRLPLDLPEYLNQRGLHQAIGDMVRRGLSSKALLPQHDVSETPKGDKLPLDKPCCLKGSNHAKPDDRVVLRETKGSAEKVDVLKVGFIGLGMWARGNLIPFILKDHRLRIVVGADQDPVRLQQAADLFNIPIISSDPQEVITSEHVDAVFISTWHDSHAELAAQAIRAAKKVFVEKPLALDYEQLRMVISAVEEVPNAFLAVGYNRVHSTVTRLLERQLANQDGPITLTAIVREPTIPPTHYYYWPHQGPRIVSNGCHWIDYAFHLLLPRIPSDIRVIPALGRDDESNNTIVMRYSDGSLATLIFSDRGESLIGGDEHIDIKCDGTQFEVRDFKTCTRYQEGKLKEIWHGKADRGWEQEMRDVVDKMILGRSPRSYEEIIISAVLSLEAKRSYENEGKARRISVDPIEDIKDTYPVGAAGLVHCSPNR